MVIEAARKQCWSLPLHTRQELQSEASLSMPTRWEAILFIAACGHVTNQCQLSD